MLTPFAVAVPRSVFVSVSLRACASVRLLLCLSWSCVCVCNGRIPVLLCVSSVSSVSVILSWSIFVCTRVYASLLSLFSVSLLCLSVSVSLCLSLCVCLSVSVSLCLSLCVCLSVSVCLCSQVREQHVTGDGGLRRLRHCLRFVELPSS